MNPLILFGLLGSWFLDRSRIEKANEASMELLREGTETIEGAAEQYTPQALLNMLDFPSQDEIGGMFSSYDAFQQYAPETYEDIAPALFSPESVGYNFDQEGMQSLGSDIGNRLREGGAVDFDDVMGQIAGRFPDVNAWEANRLSGVSEAGREQMGMAREAVRSQFGGDLATGAAAMKAAELGAAQSTGRSALETSAAAEDLRRQMAVDMGTFQGDLSKAQEMFQANRDIAAAQGEFEGRFLDLGNLFQAEVLNRQLPMDMATLASRAQLGDQAAAAQMLMSVLGMQGDMIGVGAQGQMQAYTDIANLLAQFQENVPLLTEGAVGPAIQAMLS